MVDVPTFNIDDSFGGNDSVDENIADRQNNESCTMGDISDDQHNNITSVDDDQSDNADDIYIQTAEGKKSIKNIQFLHANIDSINSFDLQKNKNIFIDVSNEPPRPQNDSKEEEDPFPGFGVPKSR